MAQATAAATPPAADDAGADATDAGQDETSQPEVIATILCYPDGSYGLVQGDEDDSGEGEGGDAGTEGADTEPQRFGSIGELLKGVMETVKDYESTKGGEGSEADNFAAGYSGADSKTQSKMAAGT